MRGLAEIIALNDRAAGREAGHADNDWDDRLCSAIHEAVHADDRSTDNLEFITGYLAGRTDG